MCLAVVNDFQIKTVESPITVYKEAFYDKFDRVAVSKYQEFGYPLNQIVTCENPFLTVHHKNAFSFCVYDTIESVAVHKYFGEKIADDDVSRIRKLWYADHFELIQTGFHFCFGDKNQTRNISKMLQFLIPVGAHIVIGIDNTLGVTDQIMLM